MVDIKGTKISGTHIQSTYLTHSSPSRLFLQLHLLFISFATGLLDASTYSDYGLFASNQTGNSIILLVEAISSIRNVSATERHQKDTILLTVGVSLSSFLFWGTIFGQIATRLNIKTNRTWLIFSTFVQSLFLLVPAILLQSNALKAGSRTHDAVTIFLLAASAGIQISMSRSLSIPEIPTAMMTSVYADIITDPNLFTMEVSSPRVKSRNVRLCYVLMLFLGTLVGAITWVQRGSTAVIWVAFALRVGNVALIALAPNAKCEREDKG